MVLKEGQKETNARTSAHKHTCGLGMISGKKTR